MRCYSLGRCCCSWDKCGITTAMVRLLNGTVASNWPTTGGIFSFDPEREPKGLRSRSAACGSVTPTPPVAEMRGVEEAGETSDRSGSELARRLSQMGDEARRRRVAKQAVRAVASNAPIEPDGPGVRRFPPTPSAISIVALLRCRSHCSFSIDSLASLHLPQAALRLSHHKRL